MRPLPVPSWPLWACALAACTPTDGGEISAVWPEPRTGLGARQLGIVVNTDDPLSASIAQAYAEARGVPADHIVAMSLGTEPTLDPSVFAARAPALDELPDETQALLLTFSAPYRIGCMGTSAAFAMGFDEAYCNTTGGTCGPTAPSGLYDTTTLAPWTDLGVRPTMMLPASDLASAEALIERGLLADDSFPSGEVHLVRTPDEARSTRWPDYPGTVDLFDPAEGLAISYDDLSDGSGWLEGAQGVLGYETGLATVGGLDTLGFRPGALADHLTSFGGVLDGSAGQMPITAWLEAGATASYGTAHEPCNYAEKFPVASVLWPTWFRGATAVEALWRSVAWPGEGNFVGDPLARPFGHRVRRDGGELEILTTWMRPAAVRLEGANAPDGPWKAVGERIEVGDRYRRVTIRIADDRPYLRLVVVREPPEPTGIMLTVRTRGER
ncbi:MAG: TIGR03790 family protein [Alphaproteobacteria bacterium]|nr:TIGR03790 family protein [Alphaproteobacteria bacterium]